ncbi:MAG TPA: TlpA disulfide reductase family protein [Pyrinomonadaceae bacterium]
MKPGSPLSAFRVAPILCLLLLPNLTAAQSAGNYCAASTAVKDEIRKVNNIVHEKVPFKVWHKQQIAMLQELLKKYPGDFHVLRRYQDAQRSPLLVDMKPLLADYREQMEKNPRDPVAVYLYSRLLIGRNTKEAIALSNKLAEIAPDFPWTYLQLAEIYNYPNFRDTNKSQENLKLWISKCPKSMDALRLISRSSDKDLMKSTAQSLRSYLETSTANEDLIYWDQLWTLEFKVKSVPEHAEVRKQIVADLTRLRAGDLNSEERLRALQAGYKQIADTAGKQFAEEEILRRMPSSWPARNIVQTRFYDKHPRPKFESSDAEKQAYDRAVVQETNEWLKQWPDDDYILSTRLRSVIELEVSTTADVEAAYIAYDKAHDRSTGYSLPPLENSVARFYLKHGYRLETIPAMLQKGLEGIERIEKNQETSDLYPRNEDFPEGANLRYVRMDTWPLLAQAYARLKQPDKAREVLAQLADVVKPKEPPKNDAQKRMYASDQTVYWAAAGKVAEIEQRKLDALTAYQTVMLFWGQRSTPKSGKKDEVTESAERLWKELGGTDQGWSAFLARHESSKNKMETAEILSWDSKNTPLAAFELTDLQGRNWSLADLKGKVAFINLWATWCGPCREELPYVQKLREKLKDRTDVLVLTLNTDQEIGKVEPFMKENKYTFPVLLAQEYADGNNVNSIPRNWVISVDGKLVFEGIGFGGDGEEWMKKAVEMIEKAKAQP